MGFPGIRFNAVLFTATLQADAEILVLLNKLDDAFKSD